MQTGDRGFKLADKNTMEVMTLDNVCLDIENIGNRHVHMSRGEVLIKVRVLLSRRR
jgi:hypothetical protein